MVINATRILVVEDDGITSLALTEALESFNYKVIATVASGEEAIIVACEQKPDLILMDINLRGTIDGINASAQIWEQVIIPVVFLTAYADEETLSRAKLTKPFGFILKPFKELELHATIQIALENFKAYKKPVKPPVSLANTSSELATIKFGGADLAPADFLKRVDPLRKLPEAALNKLALQCSFRNFNNNENLIFEGQEVKDCYIVASGRVALLKTSSVGKELTVALLPPGDIFGIAVALDESISPYTLLAHGETRVIAIPGNTLKILLAEYPHLYRELHEDLSLRIQRSHAFALRLAHERVEIRIAAALLELLNDFGCSKSGETTSTISITRLQLSQIAGTTPETTIRATRALEKEGVLDLSHPGVIKVLDPQQLEVLTEGE